MTDNPQPLFQSRAINTRLRQCKKGCPSCFLLLNKLSHSNDSHSCTVFWVQVFLGCPNAYFYGNLKNGGAGGVCNPCPISGSAHVLIAKYIKRHELYGAHTLSSTYGLTDGQTDECRTDHYITKSCPSRNKKTYIYLNAKVSQLLLKCYFLLFEPNILLHDIVINKSNDLPSKQHENQTSETYDYDLRNVTQPKFEKSQSYNTLHFIESQCYTTLHFIPKRRLTVICFQKQQGSRLFYAFCNVHYVNVYPSIFEVIRRLSTIEYQ